MIAQFEEDNVSTRIVPGDAENAEIVVTKDGVIHLVSGTEHVEIDGEAADAVRDVLTFVRSVQDKTDTVQQLTAFCGSFKLIAHCADNEFVSPGDRHRKPTDPSESGE